MISQIYLKWHKSISLLSDIHVKQKKFNEKLILINFNPVS